MEEPFFSAPGAVLTAMAMIAMPPSKTEQKWEETGKPWHMTMTPEKIVGIGNRSRFLPLEYQAARRLASPGDLVRLLRGPAAVVFFRAGSNVG
jgi:hypothetical protein